MFTKKLHGLPEDLEEKANDPAAVGWAVVFASDAPAEVRAAVEPLIVHRRDHAKGPAPLLKVLEIAPGTSLDDWLRKLSAHRSDVEPAKLPYYVTFIGGPGSIPFEHQVGARRGVRRRPAVFRSPRRLPPVRRERDRLRDGGGTAPWPRGRLLGHPQSGRPRNPVEHNCLVKPLAEGLEAAEGQRAAPPIAEARGFRSHCLLSTPATPPISWRSSTATTRPPGRPSSSRRRPGLSWPKGHADQTAQQADLLCQDWPGVGSKPDPSHCLTAADLDDDARPRPDRLPVRLLRPGDSGDRPFPGRSLEGRRPDRRGGSSRPCPSGC